MTSRKMAIGSDLYGSVASDRFNVILQSSVRPSVTVVYNWIRNKLSYSVTRSFSGNLLQACGSCDALYNLRGSLSQDRLVDLSRPRCPIAWDIACVSIAGRGLSMRVHTPRTSALKDAYV